jgi:hypothetical protein
MIGKLCSHQEPPRHHLQKAEDENIPLAGKIAKNVISWKTCVVVVRDKFRVFVFFVLNESFEEDRERESRNHRQLLEKSTMLRGNEMKIGENPVLEVVGSKIQLSEGSTGWRPRNFERKHGKSRASASFLAFKRKQSQKIETIPCREVKDQCESRSSKEQLPYREIHFQPCESTVTITADKNHVKSG